jgi:hypothetical protein
VVGEVAGTLVDFEFVTRVDDIAVSRALERRSANMLKTEKVSWKSLN